MTQQKFDVIVAGAGIAGLAAAVSAARHGAKTLLVERYGFIGGMSTAGMVTPFMKYWVQHNDVRVPLVGGIFEEINQRMASIGGMVENGFSAFAFKQIANTLLTAAGVDCVLHGTIVDVQRTKERLTSITIHSGQATKNYSATVFIDTTGDGDLLFLAKAPWVKGDEKTCLLQAMTIFFRVGGIDLKRTVDDVSLHPDQYFSWSTREFLPGKIVSIAGYYDVVNQAKKAGELPPDIQYFFFTSLPGEGESAFNTTNILGLDGSSSIDLTKAEIEGRRQAMKAFRVMKRDCPGFENSFLIETSVQVGVRETRRAVGDYAVSGEDIRSGAKFPDAIARGNYGVDIHGQKGEKSVMEYLSEGEYYEIPIRALIVKDLRNLLTAGRSISSTREGHAALRIQATSAATGEAAGLLAALALRENGDVRKISHEKIQAFLRKAGNI
jgi:hypothetical protein